ncbi:MAG: hypothetical protein Q4G19_09270 [Clostridia bacterium]|nr:hypothetical protein [Clostridia bacterium]
MKKLRMIPVTVFAFLTMCCLFMTLTAAGAAQLWGESTTLIDALSLRAELTEPLWGRLTAKFDPEPFTRCLPLIPWLFLCLTALFSGLTMLTGRTGDRDKLYLLGGAFGGTAVLVIFSTAVIVSAGIPSLLNELNTNAAEVFGRLQGRMILQCALAAVLLTAAFVLCVRNGKEKAV